MFPAVYVLTTPCPPLICRAAFVFLQECVLEDPNVVDEVDSMMSTIGMGQVSAKATSALSSAKAWFTGKKRTDLFI